MSLNRPEPKPKIVDGPAIWDLVVDDMKERDSLGYRKYGQRLKGNDGRDNLKDAYQEALDLAVYLRKQIYERDKGKSQKLYVHVHHHSAEAFMEDLNRLAAAGYKIVAGSPGLGGSLFSCLVEAEADQV